MSLSPQAANIIIGPHVARPKGIVRRTDTQGSLRAATSRRSSEEPWKLKWGSGIPEETRAPLW
jgi:hypothetical protein